MIATAQKSTAEAAWKKMFDLKQAKAPIAVQRAAAERVLVVAGDSLDAEYFRHKAEDRLLELDHTENPSDRARIEARWAELARDRLRHGRGIRALGILTRDLKMTRLPADVARAFSDAWSRDSLTNMVKVDERIEGAEGTEGSVSKRWRANVVPTTDAFEAYLFARESARRGAWAQVCACADVVDRTKGDISGPALSKAETKRNTKSARLTTKMMRLDALHHLGTPDAPSLRALIADILQRAAKVPRDGAFHPWDWLAALAIQYALIDNRADAKLIKEFSAAWRRHGLIPEPALLGPRPPVEPRTK
jgi:hypothetical protein